MPEGIAFNWDEANVNHLARHKVTPFEAEQAVVNDPVGLAIQLVDGEERYVIVGLTDGARFLTVVWTFRLEAIRVITSWDATREEETAYWAEKEGT